MLGSWLPDGGFHSDPLRRATRAAGYVENIHQVSHGNSEVSKLNAEAADRRHLKIQGHPNWQADGHHALHCNCGQGKTRKEIQSRVGKPVIIRSVGSCPNCGPISITAGGWRSAKNVGETGQDGFRRVMPGERDEATTAFGNPLTFRDPLSKVYGYKRFGHGEGLNGALASRFGLCKGKRWFRNADQARTDAALVFSIMHALAREQRRRAARGGTEVEAEASARSTGPPGLSKAA